MKKCYISVQEKETIHLWSKYPRDEHGNCFNTTDNPCVILPKNISKYFLKNINRFNVNEELDYNSINNKITEELNLFNGLVETSIHKNNSSDENQNKNEPSYLEHHRKETEKILVLGTKARYIDVSKSLKRFLIEI